MVKAFALAYEREDEALCMVVAGLRGEAMVHGGDLQVIHYAVLVEGTTQTIENIEAVREFAT